MTVACISVAIQLQVVLSRCKPCLDFVNGHAQAPTLFLQIPARTDRTTCDVGITAEMLLVVGGAKALCESVCHYWSYLSGLMLEIYTVLLQCSVV